MATNHNFIYMGYANGYDTIIKIGMTQQTCYARCKREAYTICNAYEILDTVQNDRNEWHDTMDRSMLTAIEALVLRHFRNKYSRAFKSQEYFNIGKISKNEIETEFHQVVKKVTDKLLDNGQLIYHCGFVSPYSY